jgi:ATP-dependent helicase/nuclease subunit A
VQDGQRPAREGSRRAAWIGGQIPGGRGAVSEQTSFSFGPLPLRGPETPEPAGRTNLVIEAGAGTGKTTRIVKEVVQLLLRDPSIALERIVLMTFTEKAAGEIADRIRAAITDLSTTLDTPSPRWPSDPSQPAIITIAPPEIEMARVACEAHLPRIDRLRSQTIHSFCQNLLRLYPIEAGLTPQFRIAEGYERGMLLHEIYGEWLETELSPGTTEERLAEWRLLYRHWVGLSRLEETLTKLIPVADLIRDESLTLGDPAVADRRMRDVVDGIRALSAEDVGAINDDAQREVVSHARRSAPPGDVTIEAWLAWFEPIEGAIARMDLRKGRRTGPLKDLLKSLRSDKDKALPSRLRRHRVAEVLRSVACRYLDFVETMKNERGVVDFDDLLSRTARLMENERVLAGIRDRFDYVFVDEFQDTDRIQAQIVDRLARDRRGLFVPGRVTLVGDPKQSIYAFRSADPETYRDTVDEFCRGSATHDYLDVQHRSDPVLLESLNAMFGALFPERDSDPNVFTPVYGRLEAAREKMLPDDEPRVRFVLTPAPDDAKDLRTEAEALASWIAARRKGEPGELRRIAILMRRGTHFQLFADALERRGIPAIMPPAGSFLDLPAVVDLTVVLRAVAHGFDRAAQISAARTPHFALTDDEIFAHLFSCARGDDSCCAYARFVAKLRRWRSEARYLSVLEIVDRIVAETPVEALVTLTHDGPTVRSHVERVLELAAEFDEEARGSLAEFVDELAARRDQFAESEPSINDEGADAVRIMTVHGSKGLEFDTVILPDLGFGGGTDELAVFATSEPRHLVFSGQVESLSAWAYETPGGKELREVRSGRKNAEEARLFYVAATRAKTELVFVVTERSCSTAGFMKHLHTIFGKQSIVSRLAPEGTPEWRELAVDGGDGVVHAWFERAVADGAGEEPPRIRDPRAARLVEGLSGIAPLEPAPTEASEEPVARATLDRAESARRAAAGANRVAGILLHRFLEVWDGDAASIDPLVDGLALEAGAEPHEAELARKRMRTIEASPVFERLRRMETVGRELTIHYTDDGRAKEGRIDRLAREGDRLVVVDYKSGRPDEARVEKDREQVARYIDVVRETMGARVSGLLWYVDVDADRAVEVAREEGDPDRRPT